MSGRVSMKNVNLPKNGCQGMYLRAPLSVVNHARNNRISDWTLSGKVFFTLCLSVQNVNWKFDHSLIVSFQLSSVELREVEYD